MHLWTLVRDLSVLEIQTQTSGGGKGATRQKVGIDSRIQSFTATVHPSSSLNDLWSFFKAVSCISTGQIGVCISRGTRDEKCDFMRRSTGLDYAPYH